MKKWRYVILLFLCVESLFAQRLNLGYVTKGGLTWLDAPNTSLKSNLPTDRYTYSVGLKLEWNMTNSSTWGMESLMVFTQTEQKYYFPMVIKRRQGWSVGIPVYYKLHDKHLGVKLGGQGYSFLFGRTRKTYDDGTSYWVKERKKNLDEGKDFVLFEVGFWAGIDWRWDNTLIQLDYYYGLRDTQPKALFNREQEVSQTLDMVQKGRQLTLGFSMFFGTLHDKNIKS